MPSGPPPLSSGVGRAGILYEKQSNHVVVMGNGSSSDAVEVDGVSAPGAGPMDHLVRSQHLGYRRCACIQTPPRKDPVMRPNPAGAVDAPIASLFHVARPHAARH